MRLIRLLFPLLFLVPASLPAQTVSGYVTDSTSGEALVGAALHETGSQRGTVSNKYGFYSLSLPGTGGQLTVSYLGYRTATFRLQAGRDTVLHVKLAGAAQALPEVTVTDKLGQQEAPLGLLNLPVERLKSVPVLFGEPDLIKALALTPGVSIGLEGTSGLLVRGGTQDQNLILLDEATVYNVSHLFGLVSAINPDAIKNVDLYKAGFPARYGGRLSSVLDITMKEGNNQARKGQWSIGLVSSRFLREGPLTKKLRNRTSYLFSARAFYLGLFTLPSYIAYKAGGGPFVTYWMYDANLKINHKFRDGGQLFLSFYRGNDFYRAGEGDDKQRSEFGLAWGNTTATARYVRPLSSKLFFRSVLTRSGYQYGIDIAGFTRQDDKMVRDNSFYSRPGIRDWTVKTGLDYFPAPNHQVRVGLEGTNHRYQPANIRTSYPVEPDQLARINAPIRANEGAVFAEDEVRVTSWLRTNLGVRGTLFNVEGKSYAFVEPRVTANVRLPRSFALKGAYSQMRQPIHLLVNSGLGLPNDIWVPATRQVPPQYSRQFSFGVTKTLPNQYLELSLEAYHKEMRGLIDYKDGVNYLTNFNETWQETVEKDGTGRAYGLEVFVNKTKGRLNGWLAYTLAWNNRRFSTINGGNPYPAAFDRRHNVALTGTFEITPRVHVAANWVYQSGAPVTVPVAVREDFETGFPVFIYRERNNYRMPAYHRFDVTFNFTHTTRRERIATWSVGVYNLYNRANPFYMDVRRLVIPENPGVPRSRYLGVNNTLRVGSFLPILPFISYTKKIK
ncbi:MAG: TonB-dependent receptor [Cytophagales bacterium]|nr:TonB-dependent receptor [Cytophagales bacterium]